MSASTSVISYRVCIFLPILGVCALLLSGCASLVSRLPVGGFTDHAPDCLYTWTPECQTPPRSPSDVLKAMGVQRVQAGETVTLVLPTDRLFKGRSANWSGDATALLDAAVFYLQSNVMVALEVTCYTDNWGDDAQSQRIARARADRVVAYLTKKGVPAGLIFGRGAGGVSPVARSTLDQGRKANRRVEIRYRLAFPTVSLDNNRMLVGWHPMSQ